MSDDKALAQQEKRNYNNFWSTDKVSQVYTMIVDGYSVSDICKVLSMRSSTIAKIIINKYFTDRIEKNIRAMVFAHQVSATVAREDVFSRLWNRVKDNIEEISPEVCLKELVKLFPDLGNKKGVIINPKNMAVFMDGAGPKVAQQTPPLSNEEVYDVESLDEDDDAEYPELETSKYEHTDEQGDPGVDNTEQDQDEQEPAS